MILKSEIVTRARDLGVSQATVDKDWVLGHFLSAFLSIPEHARIMIFKGGTCLRKCYFPNYRFSEDLDFTCTRSDYELAKDLLKEIIQLCEKHSGILFELEQLG